MTDKDRIKIFIRFLKKHKAYNQFFANCFSDNGWRTRNRYPTKNTVTNFLNNEFNKGSQIITKSFVWDETEEGWEYWLEICNKWDEIRINLNLIDYYDTKK